MSADSIPATRTGNGPRDIGECDAEARGLVARMTVEERLELLDGDLDFWPGLGRLLNATGKEPWRSSGVERLGVPAPVYADGPRGCVVGASTAFPVPMARGASFDPDLEEQVGRVIGIESAAAGVTVSLAVCINLLRHPAWGRAQETYGEDPHHVGEMGAALTRGLQHHVMANVKHLALNSMENARFHVDVTVDERALHEVYLPHFRRVVAEDVATVMTAYNAVNGEWCGQHPDLLGILREEWGFSGFTISDWVFGVRDGVASVRAGLSVEMPYRNQRHRDVPAALADGTLDQAAVDERAVEVVRTLLRWTPVLEHVGRWHPSVVAGDAHRRVARIAARESMVLLRNEDALLPVDPAALSRVAVLGRLADTPNLGDRGSSNVEPPSVATPLAGLRAALGPTVEVVTATDDPAVAEGADLVVVVVGHTHEEEGEYLDMDGMAALAHLFPPWDHPTLGVREGEAVTPPGGGGGTDQMSPGGDRTSLRLRPEDEALITAARAVSDRVVVCVMGGSAVVMPWLEDVPATLMVWYPGMEGGHALADVLTGVDPGGRLPFVLPRAAADLVEFDRDAHAVTYDLLHGQWHLDATGVAAHRPFGFGLSYTTFALSDAAVSDVGGTVTVQVTVANTGDRPGSTVVQVYASVPGSAWERPPRRLIGFSKVRLARGDRQVVQVPLDLDQLRIRADGAWLWEDLPVRLHVGQHAHDDTLPMVELDRDR